jgi:chemotaxis protein methyltransferase CheR
MNEEEYTLLKNKIRHLLDIDLSGYKDHQMRRRLDSYIARAQAPGVVAYCKMLERDRGACQKLRDFLTINVSEFFRDAEQYEVLRGRVLPELLKKSARLNIWSAGCSNGAEPYSIAILLEEASPYQKHRILATDIDMGILAKARAGGPYIPSDVRNVEERLLAKYFRCEEGSYWVNDRVKKKIEFRMHNLLKDPFEKGFDLLVCRNVVIYFTDDAKKMLYRGFYESLKEGGYLFIGGTETMLGTSDLSLERVCASFHRRVPAAEAVQPRAGRLASSRIERGDRVAPHSR